MILQQKGLLTPDLKKLISFRFLCELRVLDEIDASNLTIHLLFKYIPNFFSMNSLFEVIPDKYKLFLPDKIHYIIIVLLELLYFILYGVLHCSALTPLNETEILKLSTQF